MALNWLCCADFELCLASQTTVSVVLGTKGIVTVEASQALIAKTRQQIFDEFAKDPSTLAKGLLAASARLKAKRSAWVRYKKRELARKAHKKIPRA